MVCFRPNRPRVTFLRVLFGLLIGLLLCLTVSPAAEVKRHNSKNGHRAQSGQKSAGRPAPKLAGKRRQDDRTDPKLQGKLRFVKRSSTQDQHPQREHDVRESRGRGSRPAAMQSEMPREPEDIGRGEPSDDLDAAADQEADGAMPLSLDEACDIALQVNPTIREAVAEYNAATGRTYQSGRPPNPKVYTASPQWNGPVSQFNWYFEQTIVTHGKIGLEVDANSREELRYWHMLNRKRYDVLTKVRRAFIVALAAESRVQAAALHLESVKKLEQSGRELTPQFLSRADYLTLKIELAKAAAVLLKIKGVRDLSMRQLAVEIGDPLIDFSGLVGKLGLTGEPVDEDVLLDLTFSRNSSLFAATEEIRRNRYLLDRQIVQPYPDINLQAGYQYSVEGPFHNQGIGQIAMVVPLWDKNRGNIMDAEHKIASAVARRQQTENALIGAIADAWQRYQIGREISDQYEKSIVPEAEQVLAILEESVKQGEFDRIRLLRDQQTLIEARQALIDAQEQYLTAAADLAGLMQQDEFLLAE